VAPPIALRAIWVPTYPSGCLVTDGRSHGCGALLQVKVTLRRILVAGVDGFYLMLGLQVGCGLIGRGGGVLKLGPAGCLVTDGRSRS